MTQFNYSMMSNSQTISIMALDGHKSAGVIDADQHALRPNHWWLARLKVTDKFQGQGIGSKLLSLLQAELERIGAAGLIVAPGGYGSDISRLEKWYGDRGFLKHKEGYMLWQSGSAQPTPRNDQGTEEVRPQS